MVAEAGATVRVDRFTGHMGMFNLHHVKVHLHNSLIRRDGGLRTERCLISEDAAFRAETASEFDELYTVVPQSRVRELLEINDDRYCAVLSERKGCANRELLSQQVLAYLQRRHADGFRYFDQSRVEKIVVCDQAALLQAGGHRVTAARVVLYTNGFVNAIVQDETGAPGGRPYDFQWHGLMGYNDSGTRLVGAHPGTRGCSTTSAAMASVSYPRSTAGTASASCLPVNTSRPASSTLADLDDELRRVWLRESFWT